MAIIKDSVPVSQSIQSGQSNQDKITLLKDCFFLGGVVLLLQGFIGWDLGFYSDDWAFLAIFHNSTDKDIGGLINSFFSQDPIARMRPVQIINLAILYWFFDTQPLGYHAVNFLYIIAVIILFYLSLRLLNLPRFLFIGIPLIYALLPHFSTDRIWMATFQTNISILFFFLNFIAITKSLSTKGSTAWIWGIISLISVGLSILAYEVVLPMFLLSFSVILWRRKGRLTFLEMASDQKLMLILIFNSLVFVMCILFKAWISIRTGGISNYWDHLLYVYSFVIKNDFILYGLKLPKIIWEIFSSHFSFTLLAIGVPLGIIIFIYLQKVGQIMYKPIDWVKVILAGTIIYWAGYIIFITTSQFMVHPTGLANRITIAASIGVATCFIGAIGLTSSLIRSGSIKQYFLSVSVACLGTMGFMINYTIATFYHKAFPFQLEIIKDIQQNGPVLSNNSVLIIDGICSYIGPAPVFECSWDVSGALQIYYNLKEVRGDVRTERFRYDRKGVTTTIYGEDTFYPFSENLIIYNYQSKQKAELTSVEAATNYFESAESTADICPSGKVGYGVNIF